MEHPKMKNLSSLTHPPNLFFFLLDTDEDIFEEYW